MLQDSKKIFNFNNELYTGQELLLFYSDKRFKDFKSGEVTNIYSGVMFDIANIQKELHSLNKEIINNTEHLSYYQKSKIRKILSASEIAKLKIELESKLEDDTISIEELTELMDIEGDSYSVNGVDISLITNDFIKLNQKNLFPDEIKDTTLGKFLKLLMLTTYKNTINRTNRGNSKNITKSELKKYLKINTDKSFSTLFQEMENFDLLFRKQKMGKGFVIFINPIYANRGNSFHLDKTQYQLFKDNLQNKLPKRIIKYMDLIGGGDTFTLDIDED